MPDLFVRGKETGQQWRRTLPPEAVILGRTDESAWVVGWDRQISRRHALLSWEHGYLHVRRLPTGKNQVFFKGKPQDDFLVAPGEQFVIGETVFSVIGDADPIPAPMTEMSCSGEELRQFKYVDPDARLEVLSALPSVIRLSPSEEELEARVVEVLLRGIPSADVAAVVRVESEPDDRHAIEIRTFQSRDLSETTFQPSRRLIVEAIRRQRRSTLHVWQGGGSVPAEFSNLAGLDWALCSPLDSAFSPGWGVYVAGRSPERSRSGPSRDAMLKSDLKFAEVVGDIFSSLRHLCDLQRRQGSLGRFLSPRVRAAIVGHEMDEVLQPRETQITVLFCDLRGSCRLHEQAQHELFRLWNQVSHALGIMSSSIIEQDGVIGDFQGDAAMGFWGWPLPQPDQIERAARAALAIRRRFALAAKDPHHPLAAFACGVGIAHGTAIAGRLGTSDQFKIDVFGPTVNLAARLESMTKFFGVNILVDESCAEQLRRSEYEHWVRVRRLARVQPFGMSRVLMIGELLPPLVDAAHVTADHHRGYEKALDCFLTGAWTETLSHLQNVPEDGVSRFLRAFMQRHSQKPPTPWDGVIVLEGK